MVRTSLRTTVSHWACAIALAVAGIAIGDEGEELAKHVSAITTESRWVSVSQTKVQFDTHHPQGMTRVGEDWFVSSVEVIDRAKAQGKAHLFRMMKDGQLLGRLDLTDGERYHPGGIDYDGTRIWVPVAEYKPDSSAAVFVVDPVRMRAEKLFTIPDHLGAIAHNVHDGILVAASWGSRAFYRWRTEVTPDGVLRVLNADGPERLPNPGHYVDLQDVHWIPGTSYMIGSGVKSYRVPGSPRGRFSLGGLELYDTTSLAPVHLAPVALWDEDGRSMSQNPFYPAMENGRLRIYFIPADDDSTLYGYEIGR